MSVSHCMHRPLAIAELSEDQWPAQLEQIPQGCPHADCGAPRDCRERAAEYLRMQWRMKRHRESRGVRP